jgi:hypothetical protein
MTEAGSPQDPDAGQAGNSATEQPVNQKCKFCGAPTIGSDVCWKCLDNSERQEFFVKERAYKAPKTYPSYQAFCDYEVEGIDGKLEYKGFKPARVAVEQRWRNKAPGNSIMYSGRKR